MTNSEIREYAREAWEGMVLLRRVKDHLLAEGDRKTIAMLEPVYENLNLDYTLASMRRDDWN